MGERLQIGRVEFGDPLARKGIARAYEKAAAQVRESGVRDDGPRLEDPVSETDFVYPVDKVIRPRLRTVRRDLSTDHPHLVAVGCQGGEGRKM